MFARISTVLLKVRAGTLVNRVAVLVVLDAHVIPGFLLTLDGGGDRSVGRRVQTLHPASPEVIPATRLNAQIKVLREQEQTGHAVRLPLALRCRWRQVTPPH